MKDDDEREVEWPEPREDPPQEPSHPGAREGDEGWWEHWLNGEGLRGTNT